MSRDEEQQELHETVLEEMRVRSIAEELLQKLNRLCEYSVSVPDKGSVYVPKAIINEARELCKRVEKKL
jgi:hypothetical protein